MARSRRDSPTCTATVECVGNVTSCRRVAIGSEIGRLFPGEQTARRVADSFNEPSASPSPTDGSTTRPLPPRAARSSGRLSHPRRGALFLSCPLQERGLAVEAMRAYAAGLAPWRALADALVLLNYHRVPPRGVWSWPH